VVNLVLGTAAFFLCGPALEKVRFIANVVVFLCPDPEEFPPGAVERAETGQLPELLRELRDFR
jgi:hypothetical protein